MSHNWISCRNAPPLALLASAKGPFPQGALCCCRSVRRALNGARTSSQSISLLLNDIPVLIQYHIRLFLCLNPSPCHQLPWTGDLLTAPVPQCSPVFPLRNTGWNCRILLGAHCFQHFSHCPAWFPVHFKFQTCTWVFLTCLGNTVR